MPFHRNRASLTPAAPIAALLIAMAASAPANAKACKSWAFIGQATAATKPQALVLARLNWAVKVTDYWGAPWRNWNIADLKWEACEAAGQNQLCRAHGIPCRP